MIYSLQWLPSEQSVKESISLKAPLKIYSNLKFTISLFAIMISIYDQL